LDLNWKIKIITDQNPSLQNSTEMLKLCGNQATPCLGSKFRGKHKTTLVPSDWRSYIGESDAFSWTVRSGCQMSRISTSRMEVPSCQTSWSKESSNIMNFPSIHSRVSLPTLMRGPTGMTRPRWARIRQLVGPVCGQTCATGCITENFIYMHQTTTTIIHQNDNNNNRAAGLSN